METEVQCILREGESQRRREKMKLMRGQNTKVVDLFEWLRVCFFLSHKVTKGTKGLKLRTVPWRPSYLCEKLSLF